MGSCGSKSAVASHQPTATGGATKSKGKTPADTSQILPKTGDVRDFYTFDKVLGKGNFGVVHLVYCKTTNQSFACKSISKRKLVTADDVEDVRREIEILQHLGGHPNVVQIIATYEDRSYIHLVMECCPGGELFDRIAEKGHFSERMAAELMRTVVSVVHHCHTMNVIHRDLKPENFLLTEKGPDAVLKATDFGLSRFFKEGQLMNDIVGSPFYVAPEVLKRQYGKEADIWSCGVILYIMLCGFPPFHGESTQLIFRNIMSSPLDLKANPWPKISDAGKDCVKRMLTRDPKKRLTADQVLQHPWMRENGVAVDEPMVPEVLKRLRNFTGLTTLKKEALKVIARSLPPAELRGVREMFEAIDEDNSGTITVDELREGLRKKGAQLALDEVAKIVDGLDVDGNNTIDYEEFLAATLHMNKLNREETMMEAFKYFDKDGSGHITKEELAEALADIGEVVDIDVIMDEVDINNDGMIDYEEFCLMMRNNDIDQLKEASHVLKRKVNSDVSIEVGGLAWHVLKTKVNNDVNIEVGGLAWHVLKTKVNNDVNIEDCKEPADE
eukprot:gene4948-34724_t